MNLSTYKFPEPRMGVTTTKELVAEANKRNPQKGIKKFTDLFFNGGELKLQDDVKGTWKEDAYKYARALMQSWSPKHEDKEVVVGMLFEECLVL